MDFEYVIRFASNEQATEFFRKAMSIVEKSGYSHYEPVSTKK